jgi:hypothetical protein
MIGLPPLYSKTLAKFKPLLHIALWACAGDKVPQIGEFTVRKYTENRASQLDRTKNGRILSFKPAGRFYGNKIVTTSVEIVGIF